MIRLDTTTHPAIVLAVFGTSSSVAREGYASVRSRVRSAYPAHTINWAYLSRQIVERQRKLGVFLPTLAETLASLKDSGAREVVVQPLLVTPGEEFRAMSSISCAGLSISIGDPLLGCEEDIHAALAAIAPSIQRKIPNVLVCHGNKKHSRYNEPILRLKQLAESGLDNLIVASIEGEPGTDSLLRAREMARNHGAVAFIPFMVTAGEHILRDVMGDEPESWRLVVGAAHSTCCDPLAKNQAVLEIYLNHICSAMQKFSKKDLQ